MYTGEAHAVVKMRKRAAKMKRRMTFVSEDQPDLDLS